MKKLPLFLLLCTTLAQAQTRAELAELNDFSELDEVRRSADQALAELDGPGDGEEDEDEESEEVDTDFLENFQRVRRNKRGVVVKIASTHGRMAAVIDYTARFAIAPWVRARYSDVTWLIQGRNYTILTEHSKWVKALSESPVIDFFSYVHTGDNYPDVDKRNFTPRPNQMRLAYTGACESGGNVQNLTRYGFAVGVGRKGVSASPIDQFIFAKWWIYNANVKFAAKRQYRAMQRRAAIISGLTFNPLWKDQEVGYWDSFMDMAKSSMPVIAWYPEIPLEKIKINKSTASSKVVNRNSYEEKTIMELVCEDHPNRCARREVRRERREVRQERRQDRREARQERREERRANRRAN